jgi:hypothetical protein
VPPVVTIAESITKGLADLQVPGVNSIPCHVAPPCPVLRRRHLVKQSWCRMGVDRNVYMCILSGQLLGKEPPHSFLDPMSPHWIPDVDDMVHRNMQQLLGDDCPLVSETDLSDDEVAERLRGMIDKLADKGIGFEISDTVPERIAYRYLFEELSAGIDVMPGWVIDGCDGCCEECFQLPYCESGQELAEEYGFDVPCPPIPPRHVDRTVPGQSAWSYMR